MSKQVIHTIKNRTGDFKYHFLKSVFLKGSRISGKIHPLKEVNNLKDKLIQDRKLIKMRDGYLLRKNLKVGFLMAYNLYSGELKTEIEDRANDIHLSKSTLEINSLVKGELVSTDNENYIELNKYCQKLEKVCILKLNYKFIEGASSDDFSKIESYIANLLHKHKYISGNYRHGVTNDKECDIVDEETNSQIEITFAFKTTISKKKKTPFEDVERILTEFSDNSFIHPSKSLLGKMNKEYTPKYKKYLAIVMVGTPESSFTLLDVLFKKLIDEGMEISPFIGYYMIVYEPFEEYIYLTFTGNQSQLTDNDCADFDFLKLEETTLDNLDDSSKYLFMLTNIFDNKKSIMILNKVEYLDYSNQLKVYNG